MYVIVNENFKVDVNSNVNFNVKVNDLINFNVFSVFAYQQINW